MSIVIACIIVLGGLWVLLNGFIREHFKLLKLPKLPVPFYPVVGHALSLSGTPNKVFRNLHNFFHKSATETNSKICVMWAGMKANIFLIHPDAAEIILKSTKHSKKSSNYDFVRPLINDGLVASYGKKWHQRRKMITPSFHYDILKDFLCVMNEQSNVFVDMIGNMICNGEEIDIQQRLKLCTLDIICETAMGCRINAQKEDNEYVQAIHGMAECCHERFFNPLMQFDFIFNFTSTGKKQCKVLKIIHDFTKGVIKEKLLEPERNCDDPSKRKAFLDMLITAQNEDGSSLSADDLQEEVDTFMFAGHDTTSVALTWAIYLLGRNVDKQKKLHEELDSVFGGDKTCDVTFDHIKDLTYLDLVIKETLRLYPPGSFIGRNLEEDCEIDGMTIPKGQDVTTNIYYIHRHPDIWQQPNKFIPERFETENRLKANRSPYAYIPFSAGPRNCIGQRFAVQEQKVILAKFFRQFSVTSFEHEDEILVTAGLVLEPDQVVKIKFEKRNV